MKKLYLSIAISVLVIILAVGTYNYYITEQETIIVGYLPTDIDSALFVAQDKQMYENQGLKVQLVPFRTGGEMVDAANHNLIDIGYCGVTPVTMAIANNSTIKIVAAVNEDGSGLVVTKSSNITNVKELKGKKILIPAQGSIQDVLLEYMLMQNNVTLTSVNITDQDVPLMQGVINSGGADGFVGWEPYVTQAKLSGKDNVLEYSKEIWPNQPSCVIFATDGFIKNNPDQLKKFINVHIEATNYVNNNKNDTASIVSKKLGTNRNIELEALNDITFIAIPTANFNDNLLKLIDIQKQLGYFTTNSSTMLHNGLFSDEYPNL